jgi:hypothetical protein
MSKPTFNIKKSINNIDNKLKNLLDESSIDHKKEIINYNSLKEAHIYCVINKLSGQISGPLLQYYIEQTNNMIKNDPSKCIGDSKNSNNENIEIKISLGGKKYDKFNYVQIRPNHKCIYILTAYHLCQENRKTQGELYIFRLTKTDLIPLIHKYGGYAHGTINKLGNITLDSIENSINGEYALRPKIYDPCFNELLQYRIDEKDLK